MTDAARLRYLSVCSGIEAATVAWHPLGWEPAAFSEIEAFPRAVLTHHYPTVPMHGDFTTIEGHEYGAIDVLVGGTPCQDFSVAGLRAGIAGDRGNLTLEFLRLAARTKPRWIVWENVPGVLSSDGGRALGAFLGGLAELGYGFAYRVLDAQYFNLAQRRARVFVVGYLGDWRRAAAVLFERESLLWDTAPRREAGKGVAASVIKGAAIGRQPHNGPQYGDTISDGSCYTLNCTEQHAVVAPTISARTKGGGGLGTDFDCDGGLIASPIVMASGQSNAPIFDNNQCPALTCLHEAPIVAHSLRAEGFDASEDGTGRGTPIVPIAYNITPSNSNKDYNARESDRAQAVTAGGNRPSARGGDLIAFNVKDHGADTGPLSPTLRSGGHDRSHANGGVMPAVAYTTKLHNTQSNNAGKIFEERTTALDASSPPPALLTAMQVRRLTPMECERLQGFPDNFTLVPYRSKPASDGPRYKALGNSMAVPVMAWIGQRIAMLEALT